MCSSTAGAAEAFCRLLMPFASPPYLILPLPTSSYLTLPHPTSSYRILFLPTSSYRILFLPNSAVARHSTQLGRGPSRLCRDRFGNPPALADLQRAVASGEVTARIDGGPSRPAYVIEAREGGTVDLAIIAQVCKCTCMCMPTLLSARKRAPDEPQSTETRPVELAICVYVCTQVSGTYRLNVWVGGTTLPASACPRLLKIEPPRYARSPPRGDLFSSPRDVSPAGAFTPAHPPAFTPTAGETSPATGHVSLGRAPSPHSPRPGRGYMPTSPRGRLSPDVWHGLRHGHRTPSRERQPSSASASTSKDRAARMAALANPRTPPRAKVGRAALRHDNANLFGSIQPLKSMMVELE